MKKYLVLLLFFMGCVAPQVTVNKNIEVNINLDNYECDIDVCSESGLIWIDVSIEYKTESDLKTKLDIDQDVSPNTTTKLK